jgi:hypothetical protein
VSGGARVRDRQRSVRRVTDEEIINTAAIVQYDPANRSLMGPISEYYARRVVLIRPQ